MKKEKSTSKKEIEYNYFNWGPFLFRSVISDDFKELILQEGRNVRGKNTESYNKKLAGHLDEQYKLPAARIMEQLKWYLEAYCIGYNKWRGGAEMKPDARLLSLWINYMKPGDFNPPHDHSGDLSFIIFPEVPKELIKENKEFKGTLEGPGGVSWLYGDSGSRMNISVVHQMPKNKEIYIFPASLKHWVFPFRSDVTRISVSGNIIFHAQDSRVNYFSEEKEEK